MMANPYETEPENYLHDWTIEHFKGDALPYVYEIEDAERDYASYHLTEGYPADLSPTQLQFEVATLIIESSAGTPF